MSIGKFGFKGHRTNYSQPWSSFSRGKNDYRYQSSLVNTKVDLYAYKNIKNRNLEDTQVKQLGKSTGYERMEDLLKCLTDAVKEKSDVQIVLMENKNGKMMKIYNELKYKTSKNREKLTRVQKDFKMFEAHTISGQVDYSESRLNGIIQKIESADELSAKARKQFKRLQKIIDICYINKDINEEWIR